MRGLLSRVRVASRDLGWRFIAAAFIVLLVSGCNTTRALTGANPPVAGSSSTILVMPPSVQVSILNGDGVDNLDPKLTEAAKIFVASGLVNVLEEKSVPFVVYDSSKSAVGSSDSASEGQLIKLHDVVASAITFHNYTSYHGGLPVKKGKLDWTLGRETAVLGERYGADYALFMRLKDRTPNLDSRAANALASLFRGGGADARLQVSFVSLVDLKTGDVVWFDYFAKSPSSNRFATLYDLDDEENATSVVRGLLRNAPL